jgi:hypothetical protein
MLTTISRLSVVSHFISGATLQAPPQESKWLPEVVHRITPTWWIVIGIVGLVLVVILLYYFTIDEIELAIPPKIKFKRRVRPTKEPAATQSDPTATQPTSRTIPEQPSAPTVVSAAIQPNLVHPYPLQANFTGRVSERKQLTAWLADDEHPIYELVAMGGMGKSALTWYWLTRDVLPSSDIKLDGVMWWSFYEGESSFGKFVDEAFRYISGQPTIDADRFPTAYDRGQELRRILQTRRVLFVLDGFERQLPDYAGLDAAYKSDSGVALSRESRACLDPIASRLLRDIGASTTRARVLITTRLPVSDLQDRAGAAVAGVLERKLEQLSRDDALEFLRAQGVTKGTAAEIAKACEAYGYHSLSLRLLSVLIARDARTPGDIAAAPSHDVHDDLIQRQHHILEQAYEALPKRERALLSSISAFRSPMAYQAISIFNTLGGEQPFDEALEDLIERGLLQRDDYGRYDLHPIVRDYVYDRLSDKRAVHKRLCDYFATIAVTDTTKVQSIEELAPVIELYHHTVLAGRYDEGFHLLQVRLVPYPLHFRFGAYQLMIELKRALFPQGEDRLPQLKAESDQAWVLNALATSYGFSGEPRNAVRYYKLSSEITQKLQEKENIASNLASIGNQYTILGEMAAAEQSYRQSIELYLEAKEESSEAMVHEELGRLLAYCGMFDEAESELKVARGVFDRLGAAHTNFVSVVRAYGAIRALLMCDSRAALEAARQARTRADEVAKKISPYERDFIRAEWLLGAAHVMEGKDLATAAAHLADALTRCRRINMVDHEPDILLAWARWYRAKANAQEAQAYAEEALSIADRCEYRLAQADIHNFLAHLALDEGDRQKARKEAEIAKERAWCDGPPHCYKPALDEAEKMLKELGAKE